MMELADLKDLVDKAYNCNQVTRERGADDLVFYWVTQWDDNLLSTSNLAYRGEFNILKKSGRQIMSDLRSNPVQVDFEPLDETRDDAGEVVDGLYRTDDRQNTSQESYIVAQQEAVVCGVGAWELYTEYETIRGGNKNQVIRRRPLYEANNNVFWDPNARLLDKSDAWYVCNLTPYSKDAYQKFAQELTGEDYQFSEQNFKFPQYSYTFPWTAGNFEWIYVGTIYTRTKVKDKIVFLAEPLTGEVEEYYYSDFQEVEDEYLEAGYIFLDEKDTERWEVTKYICSGERILSEDVIPCEYLPIIPTYGEHSVVEGQEHWEGITRLAKDPQRLRNFIMSYIADIASRSPRPQPIFTPEQLQGFEDMYDVNGADDKYPYKLQNAQDANGKDLPLGPVGQMPDQPMPSSVASLVGLTREAVDDVAGTVPPADLVDVDLSGEAIVQLTSLINQQSHVYQENMKHSKRRDGMVYASMASRIYDVPRKVTLTLPDGTTKRVSMMSEIIDEKTGESVKINNIKNSEFEVYSDIGPSYKSQKEQTKKELTMQLQAMSPDDPMRPVIQLAYAQMIDGVDTKIIRDHARKQMIIQGFMEPETDEEKMMLAQMSQNQEPSAQDKLAQGELLKGQAAVMKEQREMAKDMADIENDRVSSAIDAFEAQTDRFEAETDAAFKGQKLQIEKASAFAKQYQQIASPLRVRLN